MRHVSAVASSNRAGERRETHQLTCLIWIDRRPGCQPPLKRLRRHDLKRQIIVSDDVYRNDDNSCAGPELATVWLPKPTNAAYPVAALVAELADQAERDAVFAAEREYTRTAALNPEVVEEQRLWESTLGDGVA